MCNRKYLTAIVRHHTSFPMSSLLKLSNIIFLGLLKPHNSGKLLLTVYSVTLTVTDNNVGTNTLKQDVTVSIEEQSLFENTTMMPILDKKRTVSKIDVQRAYNDETATVNVGITHSYRGDLKVKLKSPNGTIYKLKSKDKNDDREDVLESYVIDISGDASGKWKLIIKDKVKKDEGQLNAWSIQF